MMQTAGLGHMDKPIFNLDCPFYDTQAICKNHTDYIIFTIYALGFFAITIRFQATANV